MTLLRRPPASVLRILRREVGFGCPVRDCGSPYLEWHHFDPPWHVRQHHEPAGMVALCPEHHAKADAGAFTVAQLRALKSGASARSAAVGGRFDWMRYELLPVVGGNFYIRTPVVFTLRGEPGIWFERDEDGYMLLNARMLSASGQPRARIESNFWVAKGAPSDLECPPSGKLIHVRYDNGDDLRVEFMELASEEAANARYEGFPSAVAEQVAFPLTMVEVGMTVGGTGIRFGPKRTTFGPQSRIESSVFIDCGPAFGL